MCYLLHGSFFMYTRCITLWVYYGAFLCTATPPIHTYLELIIRIDHCTLDPHRPLAFFNVSLELIPVARGHVQWRRQGVVRVLEHPIREKKYLNFNLTLEPLARQIERTVTHITPVIHKLLAIVTSRAYSSLDK